MNLQLESLTPHKHHQGVCHRCQWGYYDADLKCRFCAGASDAQVNAWRFEHYVRRGADNENSWTRRAITK